MVVLSSSDVIREALVKKWSDFAGRPISYTGIASLLNLLFQLLLSIVTVCSFDLLGLVTGDIVSGGGCTISLGDYNEEWRAHRRLVHGALQRCCQKSLHDVIERQAVHLKKVENK